MSEVVIIAEAGVNHNGSIALAKELALRAKEAGADYVKFQTFVPELLAASSAEKAFYQTKNTGDGSQLDMLRGLALPFDQFRELKQYCTEIGITFLSTPFDLQSIDFLLEIGIPFWKVPSGEITNLPYLEKIASTKLPVVMSTGMATLKEVSDAISILKHNGTKDITLLHCSTQYPTPAQDVNLCAMDTLRDSFGLPVGYSDHTEGIIVPIAAAARGASIIEKHFTLDRGMEGPDHKASLEPGELKEMVRAIRTIERALGSGVKEPREAELGNRSVARKSIVAAESIRKGQILDEKILTVKRPGTGISPMCWYDLIGRAANRDYEADELIDYEVLKNV